MVAMSKRRRRKPTPAPSPSIPQVSKLVVPNGFKPPTIQLHEHCAEHGFVGSVSEHTPPALPCRITIRSGLGTTIATVSGATEELAAIAALRTLDAA
jgi:hypothetical protein